VSDTVSLSRRIEALLFASGKPLSAREIAEALGRLDARQVPGIVRELTKEYEARPTALEVRKVGDRYALQLREEYVPSARAVMPTDMPARTLKALTLIAYHQPMRQSLLVRMMGEGAYEHVHQLRSMGLVRAEPQGATLELTTTRGFAEHFGVSSTRPEEVRKFLEAKLGIAPSDSTLPESGPLPAADAEPRDPQVGPDVPGGSPVPPDRGSPAPVPDS
jgi:segregation and condensation protein B